MSWHIATTQLESRPRLRASAVLKEKARRQPPSSATTLIAPVSRFPVHTYRALVRWHTGALEEPGI